MGKGTVFPYRRPGLIERLDQGLRRPPADDATAALARSRGTSHLPEGAHEHRLRRPTLGKREKVVDPEALCSVDRLPLRMGACMHPGVFHVKARRIGVENQMPPLAGILERAISGEG